jgi:signal transduction histidine kinase
MIWTAAAVHVLPVTLLDIIITIFLLQLARTARQRASGVRLARATRLLALWFLALTFLNGGHVITCLLTNPRASFVANFGVESIAVLLSVLPLNAFAYAFASSSSHAASVPGSAAGASNTRPLLVRERRIALTILTVAAVFLSLHYAWQCVFIAIGDAPLYYRVDVEHTETGYEHATFAAALSGYVFLGYLHACIVFVRQGWRAESDRERASAYAFAFVVASAVVAVVVNRLEGAGTLPMGSYTAWTLGGMLVAVVTFMGHSEEITSFSERIVGITLALVLIVLALAGEITVKMRADREDAVRAALMERAQTLWNDGKTQEALAVTGASSSLRFDAAHPPAPAPNPERVDDATIDEEFTAADGSRVRFSFPFIARARVVDGVAARVAFAMFAATLACSLFLRRLFERSVLAPLRMLERADASSRAKTMFIAQLSHELRTPLSAVVGHARTLAETGASEADRARAAGIGEAAEHLLALVEGLIEEGKADLGTVVARREEVALRPLVRAVIDLARPRVQPGVALVDEIGNGVPTHIASDPRFLRQVLLNLLTNAAKNTEKGSIVCRVSALEGLVRFEVIDSGVGIAVAELQSIFAPFRQLRGGDGAGLGLTIAQRLADAIGSRIFVESEPGRGARFWLDVAASDVRPTSVDAAALVLPDGAARNELRELALVGDVVALRARAHEIANGDSRYQPLAARVDALAEAYQVRALQALFEETNA